MGTVFAGKELCNDTIQENLSRLLLAISSLKLSFEALPRTPHYLDIRLIDGSKVVSPTHRPQFTPQKHYCF
jgi:hypothetical protein